MQRTLPCTAKHITFYEYAKAKLLQTSFIFFKKISGYFTLIFFILGAFALNQSVDAQTSSQYTFSTVGTGSLALDRNGNTVDMSTGTTSLVPINSDDFASSVVNIGFNFTFISTGGTNNIFNQFSASSNGALRLGATAISSTTYGSSFPVSAQAIIAPYSQDLSTSSTGKVHYKLIGTYPNRTLVVEFLNMNINYNSSTPDGTYQVRLYEQSNIIEFVYGAMKVGAVNPNSTSARTAAIGFSNTTGANNNFSVNQSTYATNTGSAPITNTNSSTGNITGLNSSADGSRRVFTFIPTVAYKSQFISMSTGSTTWCAGEIRNVTVTIKNIGTATWTTASPVINIGAKFNANADYDYRVSAAGLAPGAQATYTVPITAPAAASSTENISFDVVKEGACWFRDNIAGCAGPGNMNFVGPTQTIVASTPISISYSTNPAIYCAGIAITNNSPVISGGTPTAYSVSPALPAGLSLNTSTGVISGTPTTAIAAADYTVTASNNCTSKTVAVNITISPAAPSALNYTTSTAIYCTGSAIAANSPSSSGGAPTSYSVSPALPAGLSLNTSTGVISGTPTTAIGAANYTITASNSCGSTTKAVNITVTTAPVTIVYSTNPAVYCPSAAITNNTPATTSGGAPTSYSVSPVLPAGLSLNTSTGVISGTPTTATAAANYTVTASNSCGSAIVGVNITISPAAPTSLNYTTSTAIYCIGSGISANSPSSSGGVPTSYSVSPALPAGLSLNTSTGVISGTPTTASAAANYTITASNSCGSTTVVLNIAITSAPATITYSTNPAVYCPSAAITNNTPTTTSGAPTSYSVSPALPAGLSLNTTTGVISGIPTTATAAANYTVTASNSCGSATVGVNITISPAAPTSLNYTTSTAIYCIGSAIAANSPSNSGGAPTSYSVSPALPAGLSLNTTTGVISGTPTTATGAANYTVTASNSCGSTTKALNITVTTAPVTIVYSINPAVYCPSAAITNNTPTTTSGGAPTSYSVSPALPAGLSLNTSTGVITGTPTTATAAANYTVTASNSCGSATVAVNITISPAAPSGLNYTLSTAAYCPGSTITANSPSSSGGAPTTYSVSPALPAGLSLNTTTGVISGTPTTSTAAANYTVTGSNSCGSATKALNITINGQPTSLTASPTSSTICNGGNVPLTAGAASSSIGSIFSEDFDGTPTFTNTGTTSGNRTQIFEQETSGTSVNSAATFTSPNGGKLIVSTAGASSIIGASSVSTISTSPVITGFSSLSSLTFNHTYRQGNSSGSGLVQISTDGGSTWSTLVTYSSNVGSSTSFVAANLSLSTYSSATSILIKFNFASANQNAFSNYYSWWAIDDVEINGVPLPLFAWTAAPAGATAGLPSGAGTFSSANKTITVTPTASTVYSVTAQDAVSGCISTTTASSSITVNPTSVAGSISGAATVCSGTNSTTLTLSGNTGTIQWQSSPNNTTFTNISGATSSTYTATNLTATTYYRAIVTSGVCTSATTSSVTITVNPTSVAGSISGAATVCSGTNSTTLTLSGNTGTIQWQSSPNNTTFTNISGATSSTYTATNLTATTYYRAIVTSGVCTSATTSSVTITVNPTSVAGSISGAATVCSGTNSTTLTLSGNTGTIQWQSSVDNTTFTNISGATSSTYTAANLTATTYYRAVVSSGVCTSATTSSVTLTVNPLPTATISGTTSVCQNSASPNVTFTGANGTAPYTFTYKINGGSNQIVTTTSGNSVTVAAPATTVGAYTYTLVSVSGQLCSQAQSGSATITVNPLPTATISGTTTVCQNSSSPDITFTGANGTAPYTFTYSINGGSNQTVTTISGNSVTVPVSTITAGTYTYTLVSVSGQNCSQSQSGSVTVTVNPTVTAGIVTGTSPLCIDATATYSSTGTAGGTWSSTNIGVATVNATSGLVTAVGAGMTDITYTVSIGCGSPVSAFKTLTVNTNTWTGVTSSAWNVASNWTCGVPTATSDVIIPTGAPMYPIVPSSGSPYSVRSVTVESGASLTTEAQSGSNQGILNISGTFSNSGTLSNSGKIILSGSVAQDFPGSASAVITPMNELEVNKSLGTVTINKSFIINKTLIPTSGNIDLGTGNITLHSSQTYTAAVSALGTNASITYSGAGRFVIERFFPAAATRGYRLMTAPISMNGTTGHTIYTDWQNSKVYTPGIGEFITGPNGSDASLDQNRNYSLKTYSPSTGLFVEVTHTNIPLSTTDFGTTTPANIGYLNFVRGDRNPDNLNISAQNTTTLSATGKLQTGTKIFNTPANSNSFILIGNPYASPANFGTLAKSNVSNQFWAYDARLNGGGYVNLSESAPGSGVYTQTPTTTSLQTQYIQSSQAVFVQSQDNTQAASVTFTESDKASVNTPLVFRPATTTASLTSNLYLVNTDNTTDLADGTLSLYNDAYSNEVDYNDGAKFSNTNEMLAIKRNGSLLSVERRKTITANDTLFFNLTKSKQHAYRFEFIPDGLSGYSTAFLTDSYLKTTTPVSLSSTTTVDFTITADAASKAADRFMIVFRPATTLPVTFTKVKAYQQGSNINVEWSIENEVNIKQYEVERSTDGRIFTNSTILTATKNNGTTATYAWPDASPVNGANYYRIKSVSKTGEIQYSSIVKVTIGSGKSLIAVYPNPITGGTINLQLTNQPAGTYNIRLLDKLGQVVMAKQSVRAEGSSTETLQISKAMAHGTYQLEVTKPDNDKTVINVLY